MAAWPKPGAGPQAATPLFINSMMPHFFQYQARLGAGAAAPASLNWANANSACLLPFRLPFAYVIRRFFWINGSTATSNVDVGVFTMEGELLGSLGTTAQSGSGTIQYGTPSSSIPLEADTPYFLAFACSGTTSRAWGYSNNVVMRLGGGLRIASAMPLATNPTLVLTAENFQLCGFTRTGSGF